MFSQKARLASAAACAAALVVCLLWWLSPGRGAMAAAARGGAKPATVATGAVKPATVATGVTVWLPYWQMPAALDSTLAGAGVIGTASPYWYSIEGASKLQYQKGGGSQAVISELLAHGLQVVPMVTEDAGMAQFAKILASPKQRAAMVNTLVSIASHNGYAGLDIDFESLATDPRHSAGLADRVAAGYPTLVGQACDALHQIGRVCEVTVMPRTTSADVYQHGDIATWVYDYSALSKVADRLQVMAYDDHSPGGAPGPIAPLPWVRQVIAYTRSQTTPARDELGVPAYGYDWYSPTAATTVFPSSVASLARSVHAQIHWSAAEGESTFSYRVAGDRHTVWYEGSRSDVERAGLARAAGFAGIAIWAAGYQAANLWSQLRNS